MKFIINNLKNSILIAVSLISVLGIVFTLKAQPDLSGEDIIKQTHKAFFYPEKDFKARILMKLITKNGNERIRELTMLRRNDDQNDNQDYYIYFHRPADVRGMTFMIKKVTGKNDERKLYIPAIKMVQRIAANDKNSSFVGSDYSYEDVTGREISYDNHTLQAKSTLNNKPVFVIHSVPKEAKGTAFSKKISWIDQSSFLPLKEEYYDKRGNLYKTFTADKIDVKGVPTIMRRTMTNKNGHRTEVTILKINYNVGIEKDIFTERYLRGAPQQWIQ